MGVLLMHWTQVSEFTHAGGGGTQYPPVFTITILSQSTLWSTLMEEHKLAAFCVDFIRNHLLEHRVVSQQHNDKQHTHPYTG